MTKKAFAPCPKELCCYCGACVAVCPRGALTLKPSGGAFIVEWHAALCTNCGVCEQVCPSRELDIHQMQRNVWALDPRNLFVGPVLQAGYGWAVDHDLRANSQSGGLLSGILAFLLARHVIDGAIVVTTLEGDPLHPLPFLATSNSHLLQAQGSKYCPVPTARMIEHIMKWEGRFAFVGLPCQILALRKAELLFPNLKAKVALRLGLFCAGMWKFGLLDHLMRVAGVHSWQAWRGWPGDTEIELVDGDTEYIDRFHRQIVRDLFLPLRCFYCHDKLNTLADVSFGDPWGLALEYHDQRSTAFLIRSEEGSRVMEQAAQSKSIELQMVETDLVVEGQSGTPYRRDFSSRLRAAERLRKLPPLYLQACPSGAEREDKVRASAIADVIWHHFSSSDRMQRIWTVIPARVTELVSKSFGLCRGLFRRLE